MCAMMNITYNHAQKSHTKVEEHYNGLVLYFIVDSYLPLDSFCRFPVHPSKKYYIFNFDP